ncbi:hypothetical protein HOK51_03480 [Candidatus Woesearchaeota archaeon]|jgi:hypothetical protein|nr:hypothetical protein [Candidatus Woesearchaeota archaeon]MBT6518882.1 hypothetical protein [Candidatus Woesearchaeota archaeon]MBT7368484.1 hypothetical protein [Candidatus Woesearchaeota archaeon]
MSLNNFYANFPEGWYRQTEPINYAKVISGKAKLMSDIDSLIEETGFDADGFSEFVNQWQEAHSQMVNEIFHQKKSEDELSDVAKSADVMNVKRDEMIKPIYDLLIKKGYDPEYLEK